MAADYIPHRIYRIRTANRMRPACGLRWAYFHRIANLARAGDEQDPPNHKTPTFESLTETLFSNQ